MAQIATQQEAQSWYSVITDFPSYWDNLQKNYQGLIAQADYIYTKHPELKTEYDKLLNEGGALYNKMAAINETVTGIKSNWNSFTSWLQSAVGISGLGILPAIPIAITAASAAGVIYSVAQWLTKNAELAARLNIFHEAESKGATPAQAAQIANQTIGEPSSGMFFGLPIKWLVIGGIALFVLPVILPMLKRK